MMLSLKPAIILLLTTALAHGAAIRKRQNQGTVECTFEISTQETFNAWEINLASQFNQAVIIPILDRAPSGAAWNRGAIITSSDFDNKKWVFENIVSAEGWTADETKVFLEGLEGHDVATVSPRYIWHYDSVRCAVVV